MRVTRKEFCLKNYAKALKMPTDSLGLEEVKFL